MWLAIRGTGSSRIDLGSLLEALESWWPCGFLPSFLFSGSVTEKEHQGSGGSWTSLTVSLGSGGDLGCGRGDSPSSGLPGPPQHPQLLPDPLLTGPASLLASQALHRGELREVPALLLPVPKEPYIRHWTGLSCH